MREALFIKKNAQKWQEYEHFETDDPDEMANRFTTLVDDLAYAKTFLSPQQSNKAHQRSCGFYLPVYLSE